MTIDQIKKSVFRCLNLILPVEFSVISEYQASPRPTKPYVTVRLNSQTQLGFLDPRSSIDNQGMASLVGQRNITLTLNAFGEGAHNTMQLIGNSLNRPSILEFLCGEGLAVHEIGSIQNLTGFLETKSEERALMDVLLGYAVEFEDDVGCIESVEIVKAA